MGYLARQQARGIYVDDYDEGLAPATSHPAFVAVAPESFYDGADEFAPFGNDDGHDVLGALADWYLAGGADDDVPAFLVDALTGYDVPDGMWAADSDVARAWVVAADEDDHIVTAAAQTAVGVALGQLKIRGHVTSAVRRIGWQAVTLHRTLAEQAEVRYPGRQHAAASAAGVDAIVRVLTVAPSAP
ncbi:hypothetical protein ACIGB8_02750 [Promicromonospora sukumoe]|uniref:hypothetical protein n=1 Tax=Promicromonospora sukumoe TaxID=88382 RepID=UPI0037C5F7E1